MFRISDEDDEEIEVGGRDSIHHSSFTPTHLYIIAINCDSRQSHCFSCSQLQRRRVAQLPPYEGPLAPEPSHHSCTAKLLRMLILMHCKLKSCMDCKSLMHC